MSVLPLICRNLVGMTLPLTSIDTVLLRRNTPRFLFPLQLRSFPVYALNAAKSTIPIGRVKRQPRAWSSPEVEEAVRESCQDFASSPKSDEEQRTHFSSS